MSAVRTPYQRSLLLVSANSEGITERLADALLRQGWLVVRAETTKMATQSAVYPACVVVLSPETRDDPLITAALQHGRACRTLGKWPDHRQQARRVCRPCRDSSHSYDWTVDSAAGARRNTAYRYSLPASGDRASDLPGCRVSYHWHPCHTSISVGWPRPKHQHDITGSSANNSGNRYPTSNAASKLHHRHNPG